LKRFKAIENIIKKEKSAFYITSTGMISREFYAINNKKYHHFPMMGSMGNALAIGIGFALNSKEKVVVIEGDGSAMMGYATLPVLNKYKLRNLKYYVLDNGCYASTGGQPTFSKFSKFPNRIKVSNEKGDVCRILETMEFFYRKYKK
jgi:thiamine pyrophosphate-dependent acetolactate synthase large subunit-like protein